ncbi:Rhs element Vgr protein [Pseudomonas amygdali pv. ulmi]|uniref:Rhs element Vgr protein n=1 Tax=Pseudomonas amygdali pv. ulmi TaxID=251720 RepID=A0A0Q0EAF5_PSEA0|nr:type VI secretion system tip protein TssI/VgrG [Pseudomonas amygdali]KPZ08024.1 Rhs element Vgr protein [Pseudomonas amygdali pv. ulmi]KWS11442.1 type IV secretion protein Rhs [Pseudomonas amygdali pv. ulmi]
MRKDLQMPIILAITDCQTDLHVISFTGRDALNEAYRFDIWLIGDPLLDVRSLLHREAFLRFGERRSGVHGQICHAARIHSGVRVSLYHLILMPSLGKLAAHRCRRIYQDIAPPKLIAQLLETHGIGANAYRFEHMNGLYPARPLHIQYDESDLHLLQRLCEEEGIHFRFEHRQSGHRLVFSDDSASFPAQPIPLRFKRQEQSGTSTGTLLHMAEVLTLPGVSRQPARDLKQTQPPSSKHDENATTPAANHAFQPSGVRGPISQEEALSRQRGMRELERLRCERRDVSGRSNRSGLRSGEVIQVLDHPEPLLNDQWLLTEVLHAGRQLQVLRGAAAHDALAILRILTDEQRTSPAAAQLSGNGYGNRFKAIPWAMPFRPSARHPRPAATGDHIATLQDSDTYAEQPGYRPVRFDWQAQHPEDRTTQRWPMALAACREIHQLLPGSRVLVRYLDSHPERPVICAALPPAEHASQDSLWHGDQSAKPADCIRLASGQHLRVTTDSELIVHGQAAELHIDAQHIQILGRVDQQSLKSGWRLSINAFMPSF